MELNELLHAHQAAVMRASASGDTAARDDHFAKVAEYAERIRALRDVRPSAGADNDPAPPQGHATIIYGSYSEPSEAAEPAEPMKAWEDEGGALDPPDLPEAALPFGVAERSVPEYHVGPYRYQDLGLALAEHLRQLSAAPPTDGLDRHPKSN